MIEDVAYAIDTLAQPRLRRCLPPLEQVVAQWHRQGVTPRGAVNIALATPLASVLVHADRWPEPENSKRDAPATVVREIEGEQDAETIIAGLSVMLGAKGLSAQADDAASIREDGGLPLVIVLLERAGRKLTILVTTIAAPVPVAATLH